MPPARSASALPRRSREQRAPVAPRPWPRRVVIRGPRVRLRWDRAGRIGLLVVLAIVLGLYLQHTLSFLATRSQADRALATVQQLARSNRALEREQQQLSQPDTIIRDARALGMVLAGERPYAISGTPGH
jgi:cell division protein FtsB